MKTFGLLSLVLLTSGCAPILMQDRTVPCWVNETDKGTVVTCPDGTTSTITNGRDGQDGKDGEKGPTGDTGSRGKSMVFDIRVADASVCPAGGTVINMGLDGNFNTVLDVIEITRSAIVCNGLDGTSPPSSPMNVVEIIDPCGDKPNVHDEVFLRFQDGTLLASFSENANGKNTRFTRLTQGSYVTTDGTNCVFNVDAQGGVSW